VQTAVACCAPFLSGTAVLAEGGYGVNTLLLDEVGFQHIEGRGLVEVVLLEYLPDLAGGKVLVLVVGYTLDGVAQMLPHFGRKVVAVGLFQQVSDAALAALAVDPDYVGLV